MIGLGLGSSGGGGSGAPVAKSATVSGTATGTLYTIGRRLGGASMLSLIAGTNSNLTLSGASIQATTALGAGNSQTAEVREVNGSIAIEYPVVLTGDASLGPTAVSFSINAAVGSPIAAFQNFLPGESMASVLPADGKIAIGFSGTAAVVGLTASTVGTIAYTFTTTTGRMLVIAITATNPATYLGTLGASYAAVRGTQVMESGYTGPLFQIRNAGNTQTLDVYAASNSTLPADSTIINFIASFGTAYFSKVYHQVANSSTQGAFTLNLPPGTTATRPVSVLEKTPSGALWIDSCDSQGGRWTSSGHSINLQDNSLFVAQQTTSGSNQYMASIDNSSTNQIAWSCYQGWIRMYDTTWRTIGGSSTACYYRANPSVVGVTCSSSNYRVYSREGNLTSTVAPPAGTGTNVTYGSHLAGLGSVIRWCGDVLTSSALSTSDGTSLASTMCMIFGFTTVFDRRLTITGDSIESDTTPNTFSILHRAPWTYAAFTGTCEVICTAFPGQLMTNGGGSYASYANDGNTLYGTGRSVIWFQYGTNDLSIPNSGAGLPASTVLSNAQTQIDADKAAAPNAKIIWCTLSPRDDRTGSPPWTDAKEAQRLSYNSSVATNPGGRAHLIMRLDDPLSTMGAPANPTGGGGGAPNDATLYGDKLHPTDLGRQYRGGSVAQPSPITLGPISMQAAVNSLWS